MWLRVLTFYISVFFFVFSSGSYMFYFVLESRCGEKTYSFDYKFPFFFYFIGNHIFGQYEISLEKKFPDSFSTNKTKDKMTKRRFLFCWFQIGCGGKRVHEFFDCNDLSLLNQIILTQRWPTCCEVFSTKFLPGQKQTKKHRIGFKVNRFFFVF